MHFPTFIRVIVLFLVVRQHGTRIPTVHSCISLIAEQHFRDNSSVAVLSSDDNNAQDSISLNFKELVQGDASLPQMSLHLKLSFFSLKLSTEKMRCYNTIKGTKAVDYFIMAGRRDFISDSIRKFCCGTLVDDRTNFVVYLKTTKQDRKREIETVLEELWSREQLNVIILIESEESQIDVYTWFPLGRSREVNILDHCDGQKFWNNVHLFPPKLPHDLHGREIKIGVAENPPASYPRTGGGFAGVDLYLIEAMASALNFKAMCFSSTELKKETDESLAIPYRNYIGQLKTVMFRVISGDVHVGIGGMHLTEAQVGDVGYTQVYARDSLEFFVSNDLVLSTSTEGWVAMVILQMLFVLVCTSLAMIFLRPRGRYSKTGGDLCKTAIIIWAFLADMTAPIKSLSTGQAIVWISLSFFVINMNTAYKSFLASVLASPIYIEKIHTVKDMVESDLPFMTSGYFERYSRALSPEEYMRLSKRMVVCVDAIFTCILKYLSNGHHCLTATGKQTQFVMSTLPNRAYHRLDRTLVDFYCSMFTRKNFFLNRKMTAMILRSAQAGLIDFWMNKALENHRICDFRGLQGLLLKVADSNRFVPEINSSRSAHVLGIGSLRSPFLVLGMGLFLAGIVFIFELLLGLCKSKILRT